MSFKWSENAWMIKADLLRLNKFTLVKTEHENVNVSDKTKHGYQITLKLTLKREYGYYIYQVQHCMQCRRIQYFPDRMGAPT